MQNLLNQILATDAAAAAERAAAAKKQEEELKKFNAMIDFLKMSQEANQY